MILTRIARAYARAVTCPVRQARQWGVDLPPSFRVPWWSTPAYRLLRLAVWASWLTWLTRRFFSPRRPVYYLRHE